MDSDVAIVGEPEPEHHESWLQVRDRMMFTVRSRVELQFEDQSLCFKDSDSSANLRLQVTT